ncbi:MAG: hypothetical protein GPJ54_10775 [Candidatus Heimdallarchaeota archaeon]|nr:hypothetical protein [Candidatus Heimdallarchaeota archaeon]
MGSEPIESNFLKFLIDRKLITKDETEKWILSEELIDSLNAMISEKSDLLPNITEDLELLDSSIDSLVSETEPSQPQTSKYRPAVKPKTSPDFLDTLNFDLKESNAQTRIKTQLQQSLTDPQETIQEESEPSTEIDNLFDDALGETMEDFLEDFEDVIIVEKEGGKPVISGPLIDILKEQGYIQGDLSTEEELQQVSEYQVLRTIIKEHPIALEGLEEKTTVESLSMVLSNLQADNLIVYTNDYQWTISSKVKDNLIEFMSQTKDSDPNEIEKLRTKIDCNTKYERQFIATMYKLKFIDTYDLGLIELDQIPEFGILRVIKNNEPVEFDTIQKSLERSLDLPPVQLTRVLSLLEGDNWITKNTDDEWVLADKFVIQLVGNN